MAHFPSVPSNLSGALVVAHPGLLDPNFSRTVVLVSSHSEEDGAIGTVINRPFGKTLGEFDPTFASEPLGEVALYRGGPVAASDLIFMAWRWSPDVGIFRLAYGIDGDQAVAYLNEEGYEVRGFLGYAGWGQGQLEEEITHHSWVVSAVTSGLLDEPDGHKLWRDLVGAVSPEMKIQADAPEDPTVN